MVNAVELYSPFLPSSKPQSTDASLKPPEAMWRSVSCLRTHGEWKTGIEPAEVNSLQAGVTPRIDNGSLLAQITIFFFFFCAAITPPCWIQTSVSGDWSMSV